jgi:hypothetical protein
MIILVMAPFGPLYFLEKHPRSPPRLWLFVAGEPGRFSTEVKRSRAQHGEP